MILCVLFFFFRATYMLIYSPNLQCPAKRLPVISELLCFQKPPYSLRMLRNMIILQLRKAPGLSTRTDLNEKGHLKPHSPNVTVCTRIPLSAIGTNGVWRHGPWLDRWTVEGRLSGVARYAVLGKSGMFRFMFQV